MEKRLVSFDRTRQIFFKIYFWKIKALSGGMCDTKTIEAWHSSADDSLMHEKNTYENTSASTKYYHSLRVATLHSSTNFILDN